MNADTVLDLWFGPPGDPGHTGTRAAWFKKDAAFDADIAHRFGALVDQALAGHLAPWAAEPLPALGALIVLDQFTRNVHRGTALAFAGDALALEAAKAMVAKGQDRALTGVQRQFVYMPYEHAECLAAQRESVRLFAQLGRDEPALAGLLNWAQRHHDIVARFGRFPHRNAILGRASSADEEAFLLTPGSSF